MLFCIIFSSTVSNADEFKYLKEGNKVPVINTTDVFGREVSTDKLKGKKILITFNRYVSCPLCNFRTHELLSIYDSLQAKGLVFISLYESSQESLLQYSTKEEIPFLMIADPEEKYYKTFDVKRSTCKMIKGALNKNYKSDHKKGEESFKGEYTRDGHLNRIGADFLVDENGIIIKAYYGKYVGDHIDLQVVKDWVNK